MQKLWSDRLIEKIRSLHSQWTGSPPPHPTSTKASQKNGVGGRVAPKPFPDSPVPTSWKQQVLTEVPVYPPFRQGLPMLPVSDIIHSQSELIREIFGATGVRHEFWKAVYLPVIYSYAHFVHLLPGSEGNHHRGAGGLFRHGLEASLYAIRLTDGQDSLEKSAHMLHPTERRRQEDALRLATFCAALLHDIGKPIVDMQVFDQDKGTIWNPALNPSLVEWGAENNVAFYNLRWRDRRMNRHKNMGIAAAPHLLSKSVLAFLSDVDPYWVETVLRSISGDEMGVNKVRDFATYGDRESVRYDLKKQGGTGNDIGIPVERYILDAMRALIRSGAWTVNQTGSAVWTAAIPDENVQREIDTGTPILTLLWPKSGNDVIAALHQQGTPGIPKDPQIIADMLLDREIAVPSRVENEGQNRIPFWYLSPEKTSSGLGDGDIVGQRVLVLRHPEYLLDVVPPLSARNLYSMKAPGAAATAQKQTDATPAGQAPSKNTQGYQEKKDFVKDTHDKPSTAPASQKPSSSNNQSAPKTTAIDSKPVSNPENRTALSHSPIKSQAADNAGSSRSEHATATPPSPQKNRDSESRSVGLRILQTILMETLLQRRDVQMIVPISEDSTCLKFPDAFRDLGMKPIEILNILHDEHLIIASPDQPDKKVQKQILPGQKAEQNVAVLSPLALQKIPCLRLNIQLFDPDKKRAYQQYLIEQAKNCPDGTYSIDKKNNQGYWFLPIEWVIQQLSKRFSDDECPERFLRTCIIGPGAGQNGGLMVRLSATANAAE